MKRKTSLLRQSAIDSLSLTIELFNRPSPTGRDHAVPLLLGRSFEILMKAVIYEREGSIQDPDEPGTISLLRCINLFDSKFGLVSPAERVILLAVKQHRDAAAHDHVAMSEQFLWLHLRSSVSLFRKVMSEELDLDLEDAMPSRVLPISARPPDDFEQLVDEEVAAVRALLAPRKRQSALARARLRPILSLDASATGRAELPSDQEVGRAEKSLRSGADWRRVFPGLTQLAVVSGPSEGVREIGLRLTTSGEGVPVRRARPGEEDEALLYRGVSPFEEFGIKLSSFGERLEIGRTEGYALIDHLEVKSDPQSYFVRYTSSGNIKFQGLSARALERGRAALQEGIDLSVIKQEYLSRVRSRESASKKERR